MVDHGGLLLQVQFRQEAWSGWAKRAGISASFSSAFNSSANAGAEKGVQDVKKLLQKVMEEKGDWLLAYADWRNAPTASGQSPVQLFYSRQVRSCVLLELHHEVDVEGIAADRRVQEQNKEFKRVTRQEGSPLSSNQQVWLQDKNTGRWRIKAWVRGARPHGRSFILETEAGSLFLRYRKFIKSTKPQDNESTVGG